MANTGSIGTTADRWSFCGHTAGPFNTLAACSQGRRARLPARLPPRQRPRSGHAPLGDARRPGPAPYLGPGAEGGRQSSCHRGHAHAPGRRRTGGSHVPGPGPGLTGASTRGRRGPGRRAPGSGEAPPLMWLWSNDGLCRVKANQAVLWPGSTSGWPAHPAVTLTRKEPWLSTVGRSPVAPVWPSSDSHGALSHPVVDTWGAPALPSPREVVRVRLTDKSTDRAALLAPDRDPLAGAGRKQSQMDRIDWAR
jgi:hypothetical protein